MRWRISHDGHHDHRHFDLLTVIALLILIVAACRYLGSGPEAVTANFIVPSQSAHW